MPPFSLAPWELPPDCQAPLTAPADFVFRALWQNGAKPNPRETEIRARRVDVQGVSLLFFCDGENPGNGNWVSMRIGERVRFFNDDRDLESLVHLFNTTWPWREGNRRFCIPDTSLYGSPGPHWFSFYVASGGSYGMISNEFKLDKSVMFCFSDQEEIPECILTLKDQLASQLTDEASEARFALDWLHLTREERRRKLLRFQNGDLPEMQQILRAALQSQIDIWHHEEALSWQTRDWPPQRYFVGPMQGDYLMVARYSQNVLIPNRLQRWKRAVWDHYRPSLNQDLLNLAHCCRMSASDLTDFAVQAAPPSAHERLEALLTLRDWWQQNFPDRPFEAQNSDTPN